MLGTGLGALSEQQPRQKRSMLPWLSIRVTERETLNSTTKDLQADFQDGECRVGSSTVRLLKSAWEGGGFGGQCGQGGLPCLSKGKPNGEKDGARQSPGKSILGRGSSRRETMRQE